jgi:hypothetical protein
MWRRVFSCVAVGFTLTACAAATPSTRPTFMGAGRDVLTAAEIVTARVTDVYQAVNQLRPEFLRRRAQTNAPTVVPPGSVVVYVDDMLFGNSESLRLIPLDRVRVIRYVNRTDAELRWGRSFPAGAITVTTLK